METHVLTGLVFLIGIYYFFKRVELRFYYLYFVMTVLCLSNFLLFYNAHYLYFVYPFFIISTGAILSFFVQDLLRWTEEAESVLTTSLSGVCLATLLVFCIASMNSKVLQNYQIGNVGHLGVRLDYRNDLAGPDYRAVSKSLERRFRPGDRIISMAPMPTLLYSSLRPDYFLQTITDRKIVYDNNLETPFYRDKFLGTQVLRSQEELQEILSAQERVWMVAAPWNGLSAVIDKETFEFIKRNMRVVDESYDSRLLLWQK